MTKQVEQLNNDLLHYGLFIKDTECDYKNLKLRQRIIMLDNVEYHHSMLDGELINLYSVADGHINLIYAKF